MHTQLIDSLAQLIDQSNRLVFFTGAGISTESGIPDFRSPGTGIWNKIKPIEFSDFVNSADARAESWKRKFSGDNSMAEAHPNKGHMAVLELIKAGKCTGVITQNVDNLHQMSGVGDADVVELHGNASYASCLNCGHRYELADLKQQHELDGQVAACNKCGGLIKTATISFGQAMPEAAMQRATELVDQCDLMIVLGSSLTVYPAAAFPEHVAQRGDALAIVNQQPTSLDSLADLVIHEPIGTTLTAVLHKLGLGDS
ncbi:MAG: NAD-dependent deacetylase [Gammaproteobacteria bacterium TMED92]|nr:MAG: NAD-dependent deacetylase [Gammaproteobacteria bacterium TMED92]